MSSGPLGDGKMWVAPTPEPQSVYGQYDVPCTLYRSCFFELLEQIARDAPARDFRWRSALWFNGWIAHEWIQDSIVIEPRPGFFAYDERGRLRLTIG